MLTALYLFAFVTVGYLLSARGFEAKLQYYMSFNYTTMEMERMDFEGGNNDNAITTANLFATFYFLLGIFWTAEAIMGLSVMTVAGAVCKWYWRQGGNLASSAFPTKASLYRALRFHIGTLVFGAFVVTLMEIVQVGV